MQSRLMHIARHGMTVQWAACRRSLPSPSIVRTYASQGSPAGSTTPPSAGAPSPRPGPPGVPPGFKIERVEELGSNIVEGVAAVERESTQPSNDWGRIALLVGGDIVALTLFAAVGRASHGESLALGELLATAGPFILGILLTSPLSKAYGLDAQAGKVGPGALTALKTWGLGIPAGLLLRIVSKGYVPDKTFLIVSMAANLVLLLGWRTAAAAALPAVDDPKVVAARRGNKQGNPLEFLRLLTSLTKRW